MLVIGLTGGIGSGKTAATERFQSHGINVVDADIVSRQIVEPGTQALAAIAEHFGGHILQPDGQLDRRALREIVFANPDERRWLESLTHPLIGQEILRQLQQSQSPYTLFVSPLLLETSQRRMAQRILLIDAPVETQLARTIVRDNTTEAGARAIIAAQMDREKRQSLADDIIINDSDLTHLYAEVDKMHERYLALASTAPDISANTPPSISSGT